MDYFLTKWRRPTVFFQQVRTAVEQNFAGVGALRAGTFHIMDNEDAAQNAAKAAFPESLIKRCAFHSGQAVFRNVGPKGILAAYNQHPPPFDQPQFEPVKRAIRRLTATCLLPQGHGLFVVRQARVCHNLGNQIPTHFDIQLVTTASKLS